jgi:hypothetical protein
MSTRTKGGCFSCFDIGTYTTNVPVKILITKSWLHGGTRAMRVQLIAKAIFEYNL